MNKKDTDQLIKHLKKLQSEYPPKMSGRSTISECVDFLLGVLGVKV